VANWNDGTIFVGAKDDRTVVSITGYVGDYYQWTGQMAEVVHNAILWLATPPYQDVPWVWEDPISATIPAGDMLEVDMLFTSRYTDSTPMPLGTYTATLFIENNDSVAGTQQVLVLMHIVEEYIIPTATFTATTPVCLGETTIFSNNTIPGIPPTPMWFEWDFGDGVTSTLENPTHDYAAAGAYTVTLEACNEAGCDTETMVVEVLPLPEAGFTYAADLLTVVFTNTSLNADTYLWDFGDGVTSTLENPSHDYAAGGTYTVTLTAYGACGMDEVEMAITVVEQPDEADLALTKVDDPDPVYVGGTLTYTLNVVNNGPMTATNVILTDTLPLSVTFVSASAPCVEAGGVVTCALGELGSGESVEVVIVVLAPDVVGVITNTAEVASDVLDPDLANNSASAETSVEEIPVFEFFLYLPTIHKN
jgi:uncharacterized repeat protein (TIGR01451 family)